MYGFFDHPRNEPAFSINNFLLISAKVEPKIHKPGFPIRPIVSYSGSSLYNLNKYIANVENSNAKNFTVFSNYIRNVSIENDETMTSFDVTSLYQTLPM